MAQSWITYLYSYSCQSIYVDFWTIIIVVSEQIQNLAQNQSIVIR